MTARYAVYFVPGDDSELACFGNRILGRDAHANDVRHLTGEHPMRSELALAVSRYGFHATLKAPFELQSDRSEKALCEAVKILAQSLSPLSLGGLRPRQLNRHLVLSNETDGEALQQLARRCVIDIDPYRACFREADLHRSEQRGMSTRQRQNLEQYGYAHIFDDFRFHMTLGGPVSAVVEPSRSDEVGIKSYLHWLNASYDNLVTEPPMLDRLALSYQPDRHTDFVRLDEWVF